MPAKFSATALMQVTKMRRPAWKNQETNATTAGQLLSLGVNRKKVRKLLHYVHCSRELAETKGGLDISFDSQKMTSSDGIQSSGHEPPVQSANCLLCLHACDLPHMVSWQKVVMAVLPWMAGGFGPLESSASGLLWYFPETIFFQV